MKDKTKQKIDTCSGTEQSGNQLREKRFQLPSSFWDKTQQIGFLL